MLQKVHETHALFITDNLDSKQTSNVVNSIEKKVNRDLKGGHSLRLPLDPPLIVGNYLYVNALYLSL